MSLLLSLPLSLFLSSSLTFSLSLSCLYLFTSPFLSLCIPSSLFILAYIIHFTHLNELRSRFTYKPLFLVCSGALIHASLGRYLGFNMFLPFAFALDMFLLECPLYVYLCLLNICLSVGTCFIRDNLYSFCAWVSHSKFFVYLKPFSTFLFQQISPSVYIVDLVLALFFMSYLFFQFNTFYFIYLPTYLSLHNCVLIYHLPTHLSLHICVLM